MSTPRPTSHGEGHMAGPHPSEDRSLAQGEPGDHTHDQGRLGGDRPSEEMAKITGGEQHVTKYERGKKGGRGGPRSV